MGMRCDVSIASRDDLDRWMTDDNWFGEPLSVATAITNSVSLEESWHGLHYLLTGEVWRGEGPLAFLLIGGEEMDDDSVRWLTPKQTAEIDEALSGVSDYDLWSRFDADDMEVQQVYPGSWNEPEDDLRDEYVTYFHELKQIVAAAAESGQGLIVSIG